jgi:hypothetical protein
LIHPKLPANLLLLISKAIWNFVILPDNENIALNWELYVKGQLIGAFGAILDEKDYTAGVNNSLHSLLGQCFVSLNGVSITPS